MILSPNSTWFVVAVDLLYKRLYGTVILSTVNAQMMWSVARSRCDSCMLELYIANLIDSALLPNGCCFSMTWCYILLYLHILYSVCALIFITVWLHALFRWYFIFHRKNMLWTQLSLVYSTRTELNGTSWPSYTKRWLVMHTAQRPNTLTSFVLIGCRHGELGRVVCELQFVRCDRSLW